MVSADQHVLTNDRRRILRPLHGSDIDELWRLGRLLGVDLLLLGLGCRILSALALLV